MKTSALKPHIFIQFLTHYGLLVRALELSVKFTERSMVGEFNNNTIIFLVHCIKVNHKISSDWINMLTELECRNII